MTGESQVGPGLEVRTIIMPRLCFHGGGGQAMMAASRIVDITALWEGCYARDSADSRPTMPH
jgi:hypothetical protein